ncbi:MAG: phosphopyruvate hydratase [Holosporales bacterium]|jgi:enolase|nr:phosphopyruvate hydratase [Holosporales bacterium]
MSYKIDQIIAREILDSRGIPTIEVDVVLQNGIYGRASVPSGASTGSHEAIERRDSDLRRFHGKGVQNVITDIQQIIVPAIIGENVENQRRIDEMMCEIDGTPNKSKLGANAILAISLATARANANAKNLPLYATLGSETILPMPLVNILNGGAHADNDISIQEFMIVPTSAGCFSEALRMCSEVFHSLKHLLKKHRHNTNVGDEGGLAPNLKSSKEVFDFLTMAIEQAGYKAGIDIHFAIDVASSELFDGTYYRIDGENLYSDEVIEYYKDLIKNYPIISIEDGLSEDDWDGWIKMTNELNVQLVGDDLFVTNQARLLKGIHENAANSILIKLNQIGTLTETIDVINLAKTNSWNTVVSHRSGETEDSFISDLSVATGSGQIKAGSMSRGERLAKYNQLIRIEQTLGPSAKFATMQVFSR